MKFEALTLTLTATSFVFLLRGFAISQRTKHARTLRTFRGSADLQAESLLDRDWTFLRMPKVRTNRTVYPEGWELIEPTLRELESKMREAENETHEGKRKCEALWPIFKISHQKSRYIYDLFYRRKAISRELFDFCLEQGHADKNLIAKWKKSGYERLCCLRCIQPRDHNFGTTCVCRVPKHLREEKVVECVHCGCHGCASGDWPGFS